MVLENPRLSNINIISTNVFVLAKSEPVQHDSMFLLYLTVCDVICSESLSDLVVDVSSAVPYTSLD